MSRFKEYLAKTPHEEQDAATVAFLASLDHIEVTSPLVAQRVVKELADQRSHVKLIASENYSSLATQLAMGNLLTDKYSEGYVDHRFYAGCENVDAVEGEATNLAKELFGAEYAYVQPHSGADANLVAFWSILIHKIQNKEIEALGKKSVDELTDDEHETIRRLMMSQTLMGMSLGSGGHLTHGYRHNVSAKMMRSVCYEVDPETGLLDYTALLEMAREVKPTILLAGYSAYPRRINFRKMREIADSVGAVLMVDMAHFAGLVAGGVFQGDENPVPHAHVVTSTTHKTLRGPRGGLVLAKAEFAEVINKGCPLILGGPLPHVMAAKAVAFKEASSDSFKQYSQSVVNNAQSLAKHLQTEGVSVLTGGTDNHLLLFDVRPFGITGRQAESALRDAGLTVNRNALPLDPNGPWYTSGIRVGTPAMTTLGMGESEMKEIACIIAEVLRHTKPTIVQRTGKPSKAKFVIDQEVLQTSLIRVGDLLTNFPLYPELGLFEERILLEKKADKAKI